MEMVRVAVQPILLQKDLPLVPEQIQQAALVSAGLADSATASELSGAAAHYGSEGAEDSVSGAD